ncbi:MAG: hypothetical protein L0220_27335, partial [Acidobacteria bacterium]|nr:hypothetical protein [Acidobacteriota bacterium]
MVDVNRISGSEFRDDMTLAEARHLLETLLPVGHACPCCDQFAKEYRRLINSGIARALILLYRAGG